MKIMTSQSNPWTDIPAAPAGQFSKRRVDPSVPHNLFWICDERERTGIILELGKKIPTAMLVNAKINIRDIDINVLDVEEEKTRVLAVILDDYKKRDVFSRLCFDLIDNTSKCDTDEDAFLAVCMRLKKWQSLLSSRRSGLLSRSEIQGLFAELYFIKETAESFSGMLSQLINCWEGPDYLQHDFIIGDKAIEIKSLSGKDKHRVPISSEDQLQSHLNDFFLCIYLLAETSSEKTGKSLNRLVAEIREYIEDTEILEIFEHKLATAGYLDISDYDIPYFSVTGRYEYRIKPDFPKIVPDMLPHGVDSVKYSVNLAAIEKFKEVIFTQAGEDDVLPHS